MLSSSVSNMVLNSSCNNNNTNNNKSSLKSNNNESLIMKQPLKSSSGLSFKTPNKSKLELSAKKNKTPHNGASLMTDRYIPNRTGSNMEVSYHLLHNNSSSSKTKVARSLNHTNTNTNTDNTNDNTENENLDHLKRKLISDTCNGIQEQSKILHIRNKPTDSDNSQQAFADNIKVIYNSKLSTSMTAAKRVENRVVPSTPDRILDAPGFRDDYCTKIIYFLILNKLFNFNFFIVNF
jgi:hypothetical protein